MLKTKFIAIVGLVLLATYAAGCGAQPVGDVSQGGPVTDYVSLVDSLRAAGEGVGPASEVSQPFFSVDGQIVRVNGEDVQVFEYSEAAAADTEAVFVSPDGTSVGTSMVNWVATPHFSTRDVS